MCSYVLQHVRLGVYEIGTSCTLHQLVRTLSRIYENSTNCLTAVITGVLAFLQGPWPSRLSKQTDYRILRYKKVRIWLGILHNTVFLTTIYHAFVCILNNHFFHGFTRVKFWIRDACVWAGWIKVQTCIYLHEPYRHVFIWILSLIPSHFLLSTLPSTFHSSFPSPTLTIHLSTVKDSEINRLVI